VQPFFCIFKENNGKVLKGQMILEVHTLKGAVAKSNFAQPLFFA